jgi:hypothetical protein
MLVIVNLDGMQYHSIDIVYYVWIQIAMHDCIIKKEGGTHGPFVLLCLSEAAAAPAPSREAEAAKPKAPVEAEAKAPVETATEP